MNPSDPTPQAVPPAAAQEIFHLGYRPALDGLRGFAVLVVLAGHLHLPRAGHGALGVDIFFTLSGFLITALLTEEWLRTRHIQLKSFYLRRVLRLYPALLLMLLAVSPITPAREYILSSLAYVTNWVIALKILPLNLELGHTWTLSIEEQYYLLWPPLLYFTLRRLAPRQAILIPLSLAALSFLQRILIWQASGDFWRYNAGTDAHADGLLLGSALGLAAAAGLLPKAEKARPLLWPATLLATGATLWVTVVDPQPDGFIALVGILMVSIATLLLIGSLVLYPSVAWTRLFEFKPLVKVGVISYGLYLWQTPIIVLLNLEALGLSPTASGAVKTGLVFLVAFLSYRYLERPILRLKDRFAAR